MCVCVPQVEWTSSREGGSNLISAKLPNKFYGTMMSTEAAAWRSLGLLAGKKTMGFDGMVQSGSWLMVSPKKTTRGSLKHVETSKPVENIGEQM